MKTFLFVVAFVLGALLTWYLVPRLPPPIGSATEAPETAPVVHPGDVSSGPLRPRGRPLRLDDR
jgi:hypothetical protein